MVLPQARHIFLAVGQIKTLFSLSVVYDDYGTVQEVGGKKYKYINKSFNLDAILKTLSPFDQLTSGTKRLYVSYDSISSDRLHFILFV